MSHSLYDEFQKLINLVEDARLRVQNDQPLRNFEKLYDLSEEACRLALENPDRNRETVEPLMKKLIVSLDLLSTEIEDHIQNKESI